jgi:hypothetical protein
LKGIAVSIVRVGTNKEYSNNWDSIFSKGKKKPAKPVAAKKSAKSAGKKKAKKK